jgi:hypothetical protein
MTRPRKLREVLNLRLDHALAREIRRIATDRGRTESEVARELLEYGVEVSRRLDAERFRRPYQEEYTERDEPGFPVISATWRTASPEELERRGEGAGLPIDPLGDEGEEGS